MGPSGVGHSNRHQAEEAGAASPLPAGLRIPHRARLSWDRGWRMVSPVGIEPTTNWLKANCSTTELRARPAASSPRMSLASPTGFEPVSSP